MIKAIEQVPTIESKVNEMASKEPGQWIDAAEYELLSTKERSTVVLELAGRGLVMYRRGARFYVMTQEMADSPVDVQPVSPDVMFQIAFDDPRIPHANEICITVWNAKDEQSGWDKLRAFLDAIRTVPIDLGPREFDFVTCTSSRDDGRDEDERDDE